MTSNLGASRILDATTAGQPIDSIREWLMQQLRDRFRPEFLNRIDEIIIFHGLETQQLRQITELLLEQTRRRLRAQDITLDITDAAVDWLARNGYQPEFGARPLRRTIQRELDNRLSRMLLDGQLQAGQQVHIDVKGDRLDFSVSGTPTDKGAGEREKAAAASARSQQQAAAAGAGGAPAGAQSASDTHASGRSSHGGHQPRRNGRNHTGDGKRSQ
jgi:ATP-dependent Clp protease ATP-binding subunit ClpC